MIRNQVQIVFCCIKCIEIHKADHKVYKKKVFKLQSLLGKVLVRKYFKTKVQEKQLIAKGKIEVIR